MVERLDQQARRQALSDLMDGDVDPDGVARACAVWREDGDARADWYAYHLIGDVLRSDDLAHRPLRDEAFLASLRSRLASEPVVLAPQPAAPPQQPMQEAPRRVANGAAVGRRSLWRRAWAAPSAVAAGFMAVAGVLVVTRVAEVPVSPSSSVIAGGAALPGATPGVQPVSTLSQPLVAAPAVPSVVPVANGKLIRDARLDHYLAAHKQYGSSVLAMPAVSVRSAVPAAPDR